MAIVESSSYQLPDISSFTGKKLKPSFKELRRSAALKTTLYLILSVGQLRVEGEQFQVLGNVVKLDSFPPDMQLYERSAGEVQGDILMYAVSSSDPLHGEIQKTLGTSISQTGVCVCADA